MTRNVRNTVNILHNILGNYCHKIPKRNIAVTVQNLEQRREDFYSGISSDNNSFKDMKSMKQPKSRTTLADLEDTSISGDAIKYLVDFQDASQHSNLISALDNAATVPKNGIIPARLSDNFWNDFNKHTLENLTTQNSASPYIGAIRAYSTETKAPKDKDPNPNDQKSTSENTTVEGKSKREQLKIIFAQYGAFGVTFHIAISLASLGFFYMLVSSGIDVVGILAKFGIKLSDVVSGASTFVIAYAVHKIAMPVRVSITVVSVPILVRYLRRVGIFKK